MKRRTFVQRIGSILAVLGITEAEWLAMGNSYYQALAQPTPRKLALLIGINQYRKSSSLSGCLTDVELQKELLIHRFGFQGSDILTLTEEQASREFIEAAIVDHLVKQAKPGDVVVFHFSGYGTQLPGELETLQNALVTTNENQEPPDSQIANYLLEDTLLVLLRSLSTNHVTAVLDTSYSLPSTTQPSGLRLRTRQESATTQLAAAELDFLKQIKTQPELNPVVVLSATSEPQQAAKEVLMSGFSAGLFTYALTQQLWESTPATAIQVSLSHVANSIQQLGSKQQPKLLSKKKNQPGVVTVDNLLPDSRSGAEGAILAIEEDGKTAQVWLGGIPTQVLEYYSANSRFSLATGGQLVVRSRTGLTAKALVSKVADTTPLQVGQLIQETVRVLPRNINLILALDNKLERIERVDATSAFAGVGHISTVVATEQPADYLFGKLPQTPSRYGLFTLGGELIPNTDGGVGEAVKVAAQRLSAKLATLLAAKLWRLTQNQGSSRLPIKVTLEIVSNISPRVVMQQQTIRTLDTETAAKKSLNNPIIPIGSKIQYRVQNLSDRPIYFMLLGLKNHRSAIAFYPWQTPQEPNPDTQPQLQQVIIAPNETVTLPQTTPASGWVVSDAASTWEHQLIFSTAPFNSTLDTLEKAKYSAGDQQPIATLINPLEVGQALLQDLHNSSAIKAEMNPTATDSYTLDVSNWASFNFSFQVA
ncbi:Peptidase C14, caspase catalytic subunit p20 [Nostoc sp. NIES-3756]|uniref:caspase family protein n=1 Tax=Nostoc sp. NIES-3756 TaxID=1751286 RepID=UPI0007216E5E|nr:caspase family protein [Nostoc sp. NIES-3756]BAT56507.1 Peptidase C14, caspase catalytic subunit p20 [Nostoc sp. NIES-3756]